MRVIATRPLAQNSQWCETLQDLGYETLSLPLLEISAVAPTARSRQLIENLDHFQKIIFISQNAVEHGLAQIEAQWPQLPLGLQWFAIGAATRKVLEAKIAALGTTVDSAEAMNSEGLLALPTLQQVQDEKILICRGLGGRETLASCLRKRGARVDYLELYQRQMPSNAAAVFARNEFNENDVFCIFSGEALQNLHELARQTDNKVIFNCFVLVPGERVAGCGRELGFNKLYVADNASEQAMTATLKKIAL